MSFGELSELRQARGKDPLCREPADLLLAENPDRLGIVAGGIVREAEVPVVPTRRIGVETLSAARMRPSIPSSLNDLAARLFDV